MSNYYYTLIDGKLYYKKRKNHKWKLASAGVENKSKAKHEGWMSKDD